MTEIITHHVNKIIRNSFGYGFKGNYDIREKEFIDDRLKLEEVNGLLLIGEKKFFGLSQQYVGQLGYKDRVVRFERHAKNLKLAYVVRDYRGLKIAVLPEYKEQAERYVKLFEEKFYKKPQILIVNKINPTDKSVLEERVSTIDLNDNMLQFNHR